MDKHAFFQPLPAVVRLLFLAVLVSAATACFPDDTGIPEPDICVQPSDGPVASVEIGEATLDSVFEPWNDGDQVTLVYGGQGAAMVPFRVRVEGQDASCLTMDMLMLSIEDSEPILNLSYALQLYPQDDGSFVSDTNFAIFDSFIEPENSDFILIVTVAGTTTSRVIGVL